MTWFNYGCMVALTVRAASFSVKRPSCGRESALQVIGLFLGMFL
jgi:hypothetical protein